MIKIISDSTSDLSDELYAQYDIDVIPLHVLLGEKEFDDGETIQPEDIFTWADKNKTTPKTSAPSLERVVATFKKYIDRGDEIISFSIANTMSASGNIMRLAAEELDAEDRISVIDSENLTTGMGHLVIEAAEMAQKGMRRDEIVAEIEAMRPYVRTSFVVDTLTYLARGGRCSSVEALAGSLLKLHPKIVLENSAMHSSQKYRGNIQKVIRQYVQDLEPELKNAKKDRIFVSHSVEDRETVEWVLSFLKNLNIFDHVYETRLKCVVCSHSGPGTLGVLFMADKNK